MPVEVNARAMRDIKGFLTPEQIESMIEGCNNLRDRLLIRLLWRTGMRVSELVKPGRNPILGLRVENILWNENALIIRHAKRSSTKFLCPLCNMRLTKVHKFCQSCGERVEKPVVKRTEPPVRRIDVDPETLTMVREYLEKRPNESEFVIPITRQMAYLVVRRAAERVGIMEVGDPLVSKRRHPHPHHMRHSLAIHSIKTAGSDYASVKMLQDQLGHASIGTTLAYVQFSDKEKREWYQKLWKEKEVKHE